MMDGFMDSFPLLTADSGFRWELAVLIAGIYLQAILAAMVKRRSDMPAVNTLVVALFLGCGWCLVAAIDLITQSLDAKVLLYKVGFMVFPFVPIVWLETVHRFVHGRPLLYGSRLIAVSAIPLITILLVWTGEAHTFFRYGFWVDGSGGFSTLRFERGPWAFVDVAYMVGVAGYAFYLLWKWLPEVMPSAARARLVLVGVGGVPVAVNLAAYLGLTPVVGFNYTPVLFAAGGSLLTWALVHYRVIDLGHTSRGSIVERLKDFLIVLDGDNKIVDINGPACKVLGANRESVIGWGASEVLSVWPDVVEGLRAAEGESIEVSLPSEDGGHAFYELSILPIESKGQGRSRARLLILRDISSHKKIEDDLRRAKVAAEEADRAKSRFLAMMSHEIRTPMNAVVGFADILKASVLTGEQNEYVDLIRESGESLLVVIDDLLDYSRIETGQIVLEHKPFEVHDKVSTICRLMLPRAKAKGLDLFWEIEPEVPKTMIGDGGRMGQILLNLISNAVKFSDRGEIHVSAHVMRGRDLAVPRDSLLLEFRIADTGIGVAPEMRDRIFLPFSQVDNSTSREYGGTGLGLAISRKLCQLMGGEMRHQDREEGGSIFSFTAVLAHPDPKRAEPSPPKAPVERPMRMLVVEDNAVNRRLLATLLRRLGHSVEVAEGGYQALDMIIDERFDAILLDLQMPDMDGLKTARAIRDEEALRRAKRQTYLIAVTANAMASERERCRKVGMNDFITKPLNPGELEAALARIPARPQTTTPRDLGLEEYF